MNNDLISKKRAINFLKALAHDKDMSDEAATAVCMAWGGIDRMPAVDAEPVRHGRWGAPEVVGYDGVNVIWARPCSECGYENRYYATHYCANCGAKMDAEVE